MLIYFAKTMLIIIAYVMAVIALAVLLAYVRIAYKARKDKDTEDLPRVVKWAKALVFFQNVVVLTVSGLVIHGTVAWQKELLDSVVYVTTLHPVLLLLMVPSIAYPIKILRKLAAEA